MIILTLKTDAPLAEIGLYKDQQQLAYHTWEAHRLLSTTLLATIKDLLDNSGQAFALLQGVLCYRGPGSFTGLRIGLTVANTLAYSFDLPIIGETGKEWIETGLAQLLDGDNDFPIMPEYGADAHITPPKRPTSV